VTGVTWRELPADAPEPPPLSVVRDPDGDEWVRLDGGWLMLGVTAPKPNTWHEVRALGPTRLGEDAGAYAPWSPPGELPSVEPSDYEIRLEALRAAALAGLANAPTLLIDAREYEAYLRGATPDPDLVAAENACMDPDER
jgi:hypothetical protein